MIFLIVIIFLAGITYLLIERSRYNKKVNEWLGEDSSENISYEKIDVIDLRSFDLNFSTRVKRLFGQIIKVFQPNASFKLIIFFFLSLCITYFINDIFFRVAYWKFIICVEPVMFFLFYKYLKQKKESVFRDQFPDALNILTSAMSSGQSIVQAFEYVGEQLDNQVGNEFEYMAKRLLIGENPDDVLERSSIRFPYLEYFFFISAIRVNIARGGQLKEVMSRINRLIFISRNVDKKKNSLTSEARMSAKIIGFLPVIFLIVLYFANEDNYNFVMYEDAGRPIFYYVLISEFIGFLIIWFILKAVD
ncbi:MAG: type II secretion system F family protein [Vibrio sp.]|uniref:type II secretion system F family protein n=1 Tax=Vibrio sp. TaxID=678 RepID=UPI003A84FDC7